jgi:hypothetical protein
MNPAIRHTLAVLALVGAVTACGASTGPDIDRAGHSPSASTTLEGTARAGVEVGCLVVRFHGETYLLVGAVADDLAAGDRVEVVGTTDPDLATSCMQGVPFRVDSAEVLP